MAIALGIYFFAYGMTIVLHSRRLISESTFEVAQKSIFAPLSWLALRSTPFENFVHWWEYVWMLF